MKRSEDSNEKLKGHEQKKHEVHQKKKDMRR